MRSSSAFNKSARAALAIVTLLATSQAALAQGLTMADLHKLSATGVKLNETLSRPALTPWALTAAGSTHSANTANLHYAYTNKYDYSLTSAAGARGFADRVELSLASRDFRSSLAPLSQSGVRQDTLGLKLRLAGNALHDEDSAMPQVSIGAMYRRNRSIGGSGAASIADIGVLDARDEKGVDYYISASKSFMNQSLLLNGTVRATRASQTALLGLGGGSGDSYQPILEASAAYMVSRKLVIGAEFRVKPNSLGVDNEKAYTDLFLAYFPTKNLTLTLAYASLGDIAVFSPKRQNGAYMSLQLGF